MAVPYPSGVTYDGTLTVARYPASAVGATLTASGMTTGVYKYLAANEADIIAAAGIATVYWVIAVAPGTAATRAIYTIKLGTGTAGTMTDVAEFCWDITTVTAVGVMATGQINSPIPMYFAASAATIGNLANSSAVADDTCICAVLVIA